MSFFSASFAVFFAVTACLYYRVPAAWRVPVLLAASTLFYLSFVPQYIFFLLGLILTDYTTALCLERASTPALRRFWLLLSLAANFGFMASFKYGSVLFGHPLGEIPLGLSFHTFQSTAYVIEVYLRRQPAERHLPTFALYVLFFPQLAAGPIERPQRLLTQFREVHPFSYTQIVSGLQQVAWGMFQKFVLSAHFAAAVNPVFRDPSSVPGPVALLAALCFPFQIYCDFAGYSDIALGSAQVFGFRLSRNFDRPFQADSMAEYWKRWHISLSSWMRDYIFYPLCGPRPSLTRISAAIISVFALNGLWHGARWNYLISGLLHGVYRVIELHAGRALSRWDWEAPAFLETPLRLARTVLVFLLMAFAFLFFRGDSLPNTLAVISRFPLGWHSLSSLSGFLAPFRAIALEPPALGRLVAMAAFVHLVNYAQSFGSLRLRLSAQPAWLRWSVYYAGTVALFLLPPLESEPFIYFQF